jgi:hypothetical protein
LREIADAANNIFVSVNAEWEDGDEAECEPGIPLDHSRGPVPLEAVSNQEAIVWDAAYAIMALTKNIFVALQLRGELWTEVS